MDGFVAVGLRRLLSAADLGADVGNVTNVVTLTRLGSLFGDTRGFPDIPGWVFPTSPGNVVGLPNDLLGEVRGLTMPMLFFGADISSGLVVLGESDVLSPHNFSERWGEDFSGLSANVMTCTRLGCFCAVVVVVVFTPFLDDGSEGDGI